VFVVLKDVLIFVFWNSLAIISVSLAVYVKVAHFCLFFGGVFTSTWFNLCLICICATASVVYWSEFLGTDPEVLGSIPGATRFSEKQWVWNGVHSPSGG
jgi:hypothetical protein